MRRLILAFALILVPLIGHATTWTLATPGDPCWTHGAYPGDGYCATNEYPELEDLANADRRQFTGGGPGPNGTHIVQPGDTIIMPNGPVPALKSDAWFTNVGTPSQPITLESAGTGYTIFYATPGFTLGRGLLNPVSSDFIVKNIIFLGARAGGSNIAGIRLDVNYGYVDSNGYPYPYNLTVENSGFIADTMGILADDCSQSQYLSGQYGQTSGGIKNTNGTCSVSVNGSTFYNNGGGDGEEHSIYVDVVDQLTVLNSLFQNLEAGHFIKYRGPSGDIENNRLLDTFFDASGNRINFCLSCQGTSDNGAYNNTLINFPYGGNQTIKNNWLEIGPLNNGNGIIDYQSECYAGEGSYPSGTVTITGNTVVDDWSANYINSPGYNDATFWTDGSLNAGCNGPTRSSNGVAATLVLTGNNFYGPYWAQSGNPSNNWFLNIAGATTQPPIPSGNTFSTGLPAAPSLTPTIPWPYSTATTQTLAITANGYEYDESPYTGNSSDPGMAYPNFLAWWNGQLLLPSPSEVTANDSLSPPATQTFTFQVPVVPGMSNYLSIHNPNSIYGLGGPGNRALNIIGATLNGVAPDVTSFSIESSDGGPFTGWTVGTSPPPTDTTPPVLTAPTTLTVQQGLSTLLQLSATDNVSPAGQVTYSITSGPSHGIVEIETPVTGGTPAVWTQTSSFTQSDVTNQLVAYLSNGAAGADSFNFNVCDASGNCTAGTQNLTVTADTTAPALTTPTTLTLAAGTSANLALSATDADNSASQINYTVTTPPTHGNVMMGGVQVTKFTQAEVTAGSVSFESTGTAAASDSFAFSVCDPANNCVNGTQPITITSSSTVPTFPAPTTLSVIIGGTVKLAFAATDPNYNSSQLTFTFVAPADGIILDKGLQVTSFTQADVTGGLVEYESTGSAPATDTFSVTVKDPAGNSTTQSQTVDVVTDTTDPVLAAPVTLTVTAGTTADAVSGTNLSATDANYPAGVLTFSIPLATGQGSITTSTNTYTAGQTATFTQTQLTSGAVTYTPPTTVGNITLAVTVKNPANLASSAQNWTIDVVADTTPPVLTAPTPISLVLGQSAKLALSSTDNVSDLDQITYTVTSVSTLGSVEINGAPVTTFTQTQVSDGDVVFALNGTVGSSGLGFNVADAAGNTTSGTLSITVSKAATPPQVAAPGTLAALGGVAIDLDLTASSPYYTDAQLKYTVTNAPTNGEILVSGQTASSFTQQDIDNKLVTYTSNGTQTVSDSIGLVLSDPSGNTTSVTVPVAITGSEMRTLPPAALSLHMIPCPDGTWHWNATCG